MASFQFAGTPALYVGNGMIAKLADALPKGARHILFVMGSFRLTNAKYWNKIVKMLSVNRITYDIAHIRHEPTVEWVDAVVNRYRAQGSANGRGDLPPLDAVVAIGGGSALDAGKAVSAMLCTEPGDTVLHYLEKQPAYRPPSGKKVFFVAIPTTSGTGSETTKNAVIAIPGEYKRSIRHDRFIPNVAIVDADLTISCPASVKAASGLDALTQLIESYVSINASPITDALALSGMKAVAKSLLAICTTAAEDANLHAQMAYAAMLSGITLANAGLGLVHGLAGPLGGSFSIPHGVICGTLLAETTKRNIAFLRQEKSDKAATALAKYGKVGSIITGHPESDLAGCLERLVEILEQWTKRLQIPRLGQFGVNAGNIGPIIAAADNKQSPAILDQSAMRDILLARI
ncbi:MAG TPA: iron-containing alcohol dehydrogenase [Bacilli bacterium]